MSERDTHQIVLTVDSSGAVRGFVAAGEAGEAAAKKIEAVGAKGAPAIDRAAASAAKATGTFQRFGQGMSSLERAASGVLAAELTGWLGDAARAAAEVEAVNARVAVAFDNAGASAAAYAGEIAAASAAAEALGFDGDDAADSLAAIVGVTGDAESSFRLLAVAEDLARARGIALADAATIVARAHEGQTTALARMGIQLDENASGMAAVEAINARYAGSADAYAQTQAGAIDRANVAWGNFVETVGGFAGPAQTALALLPAATQGYQMLGGAVGALSDRIPAMVKGMRDGTGALRGFSAGLSPMAVGLGGVGVAVSAGILLWDQYAEAVAKGEAANLSLEESMESLGDPQTIGRVRDLAIAAEDLSTTNINDNPWKFWETGLFDVLGVVGRVEQSIGDALDAVEELDDPTLLDGAIAAGEKLKAAVRADDGSFDAGAYADVWEDIETIAANGSDAAIADFERLNAEFDAGRLSPREYGAAIDDTADRTLRAGDAFNDTTADVQGLSNALDDAQRKAVQSLPGLIEAASREEIGAAEETRDAAIAAAEEQADGIIAAADRGYGQKARIAEREGREEVKAAEETGRAVVREATAGEREATRAAERAATLAIAAAERAESEAVAAAESRADGMVAAAEAEEAAVVDAAQNAADQQIAAAERAERQTVQAAERAAQANVRAVTTAARETVREAERAGAQQEAAADRLEAGAEAAAEARYEAVVGAARAASEAEIRQADETAEAQIAAAKRATDQRIAQLDRWEQRQASAATAETNEALRRAMDAATGAIGRGANPGRVARDLARAQADAYEEGARRQEQIVAQADRRRAAAEEAGTRRIDAIEAHRERVRTEAEARLAAVEAQADAERQARTEAATRQAEAMRTAAARNVAVAEREADRAVTEVRRENDRAVAEAAREAARETEQVRLAAAANVAAAEEAAAANTARAQEEAAAYVERVQTEAARRTELVRREEMRQTTQVARAEARNVADAQRAAAREVAAEERERAQELRAIDRARIGEVRSAERELAQERSAANDTYEEEVGRIEQKWNDVRLAVANANDEAAGIMEAAGIVSEGADGEWRIEVNPEAVLVARALEQFGEGPFRAGAPAGGTAQRPGPTARMHGGLVPGYANGGVLPARHGRVLVGEAGPELVQLPAGSRVVPNPATEAMLGSGGLGGVTVTVNVGGDVYGLEDFEAKAVRTVLPAVERAVRLGMGAHRRALGA